MKYLLAIFLFALIPINYWQKSIESKPVESDDYLIYSLLLGYDKSPNDGKPVKQLVIGELTLKSPKAKCEPEKMLVSAKKKLTPELKSAITNFEEKNQNSISVSKNFIIKKPYVLISAEELNQIFKKGSNGWESFYKKYPNSPGFIQFSQVGYNSNNTVAWVYSVLSCGGECADGSYYIFEKKGNSWKETKTLTCWVS